MGMAGEQLRTFLRRLRCAFAAEAGGLSDAQLLERFVTRRDEAAFEVLVWRHGGLVLSVCGRLLPNAEDREDVFQATFLALTRRAGCIAKGGALGSWLYKVAYRVALRVRARSARDAVRQRVLAAVGPRPANGEVAPDLRAVLDEEINRLPEKYRTPVVLCYLEGKTTEEAARQLGCARGTVCSRLSWARQRLRSRLTRRGLALSAAGLGVPLAPGVTSAALVGATVRAAVSFTAKCAAGALPGQAAALAEGVLRTMVWTKLKTAAVLLFVAGVLGVGAGLSTQRLAADRPGAEEAPALVRGSGDGVRLPLNLLAKLGIQAAEVKARAAQPRVLVLQGSLALDPERLTRVRCRFAPAEVVEIGKPGGEEGNRPLRPGDKVRKGQLLAVFSSADVSRKKNELLDALVQLRLDETILERMEKAKDAVPEVAILNARRSVQADRNAVNRAQNTLKTWGISQEDIDAVSKEADEVARRKGKSDPATEKQWGRVELRAPQDGTIVERNVALHEIVADNTTNLFQIALMGRLLVVAQVHEDDLPALEALKPEQRRWAIRTKADPDAPAMQGRFDEVGYLIDPNQHTAVVKGFVDNLEGRLRLGQFITATITLPPAAGEVVLPASAAVEGGGQTFVFVQPDAKKGFYEQRRVAVVRRGQDVVHIRARLTPEQERQGFQTVRPGDRVVTAGVVELKALLDDLKAAADR
jgi:cobalt-zinc-cadmium efflux system membrane fusion protein